MYIPDSYRGDERNAVELMQRYPLALMMSGSHDGLPFATHLPTVIPPDTAEALSAGTAPLAGISIFGHLNRSNPHWQALQDGGQALLVFSGPNSYISPTLYDPGPAAPTWNFISVHARGSVRPIVDRDQTLDVIRRTVTSMETAFGGGWDMTGSLEYFDRIVSGVGAFELKIETVDCMMKLSQEKNLATRQQVIEGLSRQEGSVRDICHWMKRSVQSDLSGNA